jgi:hypothetical protein
VRRTVPKQERSAATSQAGSALHWAVAADRHKPIRIRNDSMRRGIGSRVNRGYLGSVHRWSWWFGLGLGGLLVAAGIGETVRLVRSGDGGFLFWFPTLVGGGLLVLGGTLLRPRRPILGFVLTTVGCVAAILPTAWTVIVPVLLLVVIVVSAKQTAALLDKQKV